MNSKRDQELLCDYAQQGSEEAFAELARRYADSVYSAALRMVGNLDLAQEITQAVFVALSQNARPLSRRAVLSGWLHRTAQNLAAKTVRAEARRRAREQEAAAMNENAFSQIEPVWERIAPYLDEALGQLNRDRQGFDRIHFLDTNAPPLSDERQASRLDLPAEMLEGVHDVTRQSWKPDPWRDDEATVRFKPAWPDDSQAVDKPAAGSLTLRRVGDAWYLQGVGFQSRGIRPGTKTGAKTGLSY